MLNLVHAMMAAAKLRQGNTLFDGSAAGLRISAVDGTAFLDNLPAAALGYVNGRNWVTITDSAGKKLEGVLYQKGTGETYGTEGVVNGDMELDASWVDNLTPPTNERSSEQARNGTYSRKLVIDSIFEGISQNTAYTALALYRAMGYVYPLNDNTVAIAGIGSTSNRSVISPTINEWNELSYSATATSSSGILLLQIRSGSTGTFYFDDVSLKQVLTPSTSGCTIVDGELSPTENFASVEAGFAFNESSYSLTITRDREV